MTGVVEAHKILCEMFLLCLILEKAFSGERVFFRSGYFIRQKCVLNCAEIDTRNVFGFGVEFGVVFRGYFMPRLNVC